MSLLVGPGAVYGWAQYSITFWVTGRQCGRLSACLVLVRSYCSAEGWINRRALFERVLDTLKNLFGLLPHILSWVLFHTLWLYLEAECPWCCSLSNEKFWHSKLYAFICPSKTDWASSRCCLSLLLSVKKVVSALFFSKWRLLIKCHPLKLLCLIRCQC